MISVIIPTYNRKRLLKNCLKRLFIQSYPKKKYEIIVVDDGSSDQTGSMIKTRQKEFASLFYFRQKHQGPAAARNLGIKKAKGEIIAFTDDDCFPKKNWLEKIAQAFKNYPTTLGIEGKTLAQKKKADLMTTATTNQSGGQYFTCNIAYQKVALNQVGGFDQSFAYSHCEDIDLAIRILKISPIIFVPQIEVIHPLKKVGLLSGLKKLSYLKDEFRLYLKHEDYFNQAYPLKNQIAVFFLITFFNHIWFRIVTMINSLKKFSASPTSWIKFVTKNIIEMIYIVLIFPCSIWQIKKTSR